MRSLTTRTKAVLLALAIFILGMVCGAIADRHFLLERYRGFSGRWRGREGGRLQARRTGYSPGTNGSWTCHRNRRRS